MSARQSKRKADDATIQSKVIEDLKSQKKSERKLRSSSRISSTLLTDKHAQVKTGPIKSTNEPKDLAASSIRCSSEINRRTLKRKINQVNETSAVEQLPVSDISSVKRRITNLGIGRNDFRTNKNSGKVKQSDKGIVGKKDEQTSNMTSTKSEISSSSVVSGTKKDRGDYYDGIKASDSDMKSRVAGRNAKQLTKSIRHKELSDDSDEGSDTEIESESEYEISKAKGGRRHAREKCGKSVKNIDSKKQAKQGPKPPATADEILAAAEARPPVYDSDYLPLPWSGRLGYACINTYLRMTRPPVFCSRTCRISSLIEHRHPLMYPEQPEHKINNRPNLHAAGLVELGKRWVQNIGIQNARDCIKLIEWNEKYGIKFMRLSSDMFPFASHPEHGYDLKDCANKVLRELGAVITKYNHRVTMHPGQYTQLGSPREHVVKMSIRDLEYHNQLLDLLCLPDQQDRDAVMILHMGGVFGDRKATLDRFRKNYRGLSKGAQRRLVLENDDVSWSIHDLLPICEELNIPLVFDWHHHNIVHDESLREGSLDVLPFMEQIEKTWTRKGIKQKMHYSESRPGTITRAQRRKHSSRVEKLPPCKPDMDLMIEAKDKEQAVFELMRKYELPGHDLFREVIPFVQVDRNRITRKGEVIGPVDGGEPLSDSEIGMGGPERRVWWPEGKESWLKAGQAKVGGGSMKNNDTELEVDSD